MRALVTDLSCAAFAPPASVRACRSPRLPGAPSARPSQPACGISFRAETSARRLQATMSLTHPTCTPRPALATRHNIKTVFGHAVRILLAYTAGDMTHRAQPRAPRRVSARKAMATTPACAAPLNDTRTRPYLLACGQSASAAGTQQRTCRALGPRQGRATSVARRRVSARKLRAKTAEPSLICASPGHAVDDLQTELHDKPAGCSTPRHMNHQAHGQAEFTVDANQERSAICSLLLLPACVSVLRQLVAAFFLHLNISTY